MPLIEGSLSPELFSEDLAIRAFITSYLGDKKILEWKAIIAKLIVIVKGSIHIVTNREEMIRGLMRLCEKYSPGVDPDEEIAKCISHVSVLRLDVDSFTGKEAIELVVKH